MIRDFKGEYAFLSNYYKTPVNYNGLKYNSSEAAFHAQKTLDEDKRLKFIELTPSEAKRLGRRIKLRKDWENIKLNIMREILESKFSDKKLKIKLLNTYPNTLVEANTWNDRFWGVDAETGDGLNNLGFLLTEIRDKMLDDISNDEGNELYDLDIVKNYRFVKSFKCREDN